MECVFYLFLETFFSPYCTFSLRMLSERRQQAVQNKNSGHFVKNWEFQGGDSRALNQAWGLPEPVWLYMPWSWCWQRALTLQMTSSKLPVFVSRHLWPCSCNLFCLIWSYSCVEGNSEVVMPGDLIHKGLKCRIKKKKKLFILCWVPGGSDGKASVYNAGDLVRSLGLEDPLEKEMAVHSSTIAWKIPWMEEPGRLQSMGSPRVRHDWATPLHIAD